jgi:hypothetical protein
MADASTWTRAHPSGASLLRDFDDLHRSDKSIFEASFLEEHYWKDGSAASAGEHRLGSARIYSGASSEVSASGQSGRLMWDHTNAQLVALHAATTTRIPSLVANNTWSGTQTFSAAVTCSSTLVVTGVSTFADSLRLSTNSKFFQGTTVGGAAASMLGLNARDLVVMPRGACWGSDTANPQVSIKSARINSSTAWQTIFSATGTTTVGVAIVTICTGWGSPSGTTSITKVMVRGDKTFQIIEQYGAATNGYNSISFQWFGDDFQVSTSSTNVWYSIYAEIHEISGSSALRWNFTWSI